MSALRILLVDDSPAERELAGEAIAEFAPDLELTTVGGRDELLAWLANEPLPDLLLIDLHLGPDRGSAIAAELRDHPAQAVPLVILTTTEDAVERANCLSAGAHDFWIKPLHFADYPLLIERARALAGQRRSATFACIRPG